MSVVAPPPQDELELLIREARARQRRRRLLALAVIAAVAALGLAVYSAFAGGHPASKQGHGGRIAVASLTRCRSNQLRLSAPKTWGAAAGSLIEQFTFTNVSGTGCTVAGWPAVRRFTAAGQPIPASFQRWVYAQRGPRPFRVVPLRPGRAATFPIVGEDWNHAADRACREAGKVQVEPRGGGGWLSVALNIPACRRWDVGPLVPGRSADWPTFALSQFVSLPTADRPFYSGRESGMSWRLRVRDSGDGRYCFQAFTDGTARASTCGRLHGPGIPGKLGWIARSRGRSFVAGAVISRAQVLAVALSDGRTRYLQTMPPTRRLTPGISFFFTAIPRGTYPVAIRGHTHAGRRVVTWSR